LNGYRVSAEQRAAGGEIQDERRSGVGAKLDQKKFAKWFAGANDPTNHALAKPCLVTSIEDDEVGDRRSFDSHDPSLPDGALRDDRGRQ
jgi:hypothetical protein